MTLPLPTAPVTRPTARPDLLGPEGRLRLRAAAARAGQLYPGPVGELIARELDIWAELGYRIGPGLAARLADHVLDAPLPSPGVAP